MKEKEQRQKELEKKTFEYLTTPKRPIITNTEKMTMFMLEETNGRTGRSVNNKIKIIKPTDVSANNGNTNSSSSSSSMVKKDEFALKM